MSLKHNLRSRSSINISGISGLKAQTSRAQSSVQAIAGPGAKVHSRRRQPQASALPPPSKRARTETSIVDKEATASLPKFDIASSASTTSNGAVADKKLSYQLDRPVVPNRTIAPLVTPKGSRVVTYPTAALDESPSKTGGSPPTTSTGKLLDEACAHLIKVEPRMRPLIEKHYCRVFCPESLAEECNPFKALCSGIMAQQVSLNIHNRIPYSSKHFHQVSGAAASSIKKKFIRLFCDSQNDETMADGMFPTPQQVMPCSVSYLRTAGLSERKAEYIKGLAEKFANGDLSAAMLINASDEEVLERLTAVRGLGKWSVEMFACFSLKRTDIFSTGDLGVQRGLAAFVGKDIKKLKAKGGGKWKYMSEQDMIGHSEKFAPYRSIFMWYMWRVEDVDTNVVEEM